MARPPVQLPFERRRTVLADVTDVQGQVHVLTAPILLIGAGEIVLDVNFPVLFFEKPVVIDGAELQQGQTLTAGSYPTCDAVVYQWDIWEHETGDYYRGASIVVVTGGTSSQRMIVNLRFEGRAIRNPRTDQSETIV